VVSSDRYQRRRDLGTGGMATVHEAWDSHLERRVAIKEPLPEVVRDQGFRRRFLAEGRKLALVHHPHVVEIYDVDAQHDPPRMIMELADGGNLREAIEGGPMAPRQALAIVRQLLEGLAAVHLAGLVHRDLKPENVLRFGTVFKIADFGVAKLPSERTQRYVTPRYAAPEIQTGGGAGPRADVYSLGLIAYELMTGAERFASLVATGWQRAGQRWKSDRGAGDGTGGGIPWTAWHLDPDMVLPSLDREVAVSPSVAAVVARMIAKAPAARYADGRSVLSALAAADHAVPETDTETVPEPLLVTAGVSPAGVSPAGVSPAGRRRGLFWGLASGALLVVAGGATFMVWNGALAAPGLGHLLAASSADGSSSTGSSSDGSSSTGSSSTGLPADTALRARALEQLRRGEYAQAADLLGRAVARMPEDPELLEAAVRSELKLANYGRAEALLERLAAVLPPAAPKVAYFRGVLTLARAPNRGAAAAALLERATGEPGVPPEGDFYLGFARMQTGDAAGARSAFERFLAHDGRSASLAERARRYLQARPAPPVGVASAFARPLRLRGFERPDLMLEELRGTVVVLHLWAAWCVPCRKELPALARFYHREYPQLEARGLRVLTVSSDFALADVRAFLGGGQSPELFADFPIYWDPDTELNLALGLGSALPQTVILDRRGRRLRQVTGPVDWGGPRLSSQLASYL